MAVLPLGTLVTNLRLEAGQSSSPSAGVNMRDQLVYVLNRVQEQLAQDWDWPGLVADRDIPIVAGTRYYNYPVDMPFENINHVWLVWNTLYGSLRYGIGPAEFALFNSNVGFTSWPVERWMNNTDLNQFELWPVPNQAPPATAANQAALIRMRGTRQILPMVADTDMCVLPATIITLFAAAELLAREGDKGAGLKLTTANNYLRRYRVRQSAHKSKPFVIGGGDEAWAHAHNWWIGIAPGGTAPGPSGASPTDFSNTDFGGDFNG